MLFEGWGLQYASWDGHPFNVHNNVQDINGDPNGDGKGTEIQTLAIPTITRIQEAYVRKVIDTVNDLDNVLFEITNESGLYSTEWQYHMIRYIQEYERHKPNQHPVGMTTNGYGGEDDTDRLFHSPADWISPSPEREDYKCNPPASLGAKIILADTDHLWGIGGERSWVWKSFLRGGNPIWMNPYERASLWEPLPANAEDVRRNLGYTLRYAQKMNLADMTPQKRLSSTGYCLAHIGAEYLIYQPQSGETFSVDLAAGTYRSEWFDPAKGVLAGRDHLLSSGGVQQFKAPFAGDAVLYLKAQYAKAAQERAG